MPGPLALAGIGAAAGALSHLFGGGGGDQRTTQTIGQNDQNYVNYMRAFAQNALQGGMPALDPSIMSAMQGYGGYADAGRMGLNAFTDPSTMAKFQAYGMNAMDPYFDRRRMQLGNEHRARMAGARAFGVRGQMMGPDYSGIDQQQQEFMLRNMENAQRNAMQFAQFGQFGIGGQHNLGQWLTNRPMEYAQQGAGILSGSYGGPMETITTSPNPNDQGSLGQSILGGAMTGLSFARPGAGAPAPSPVVSQLHQQGYGWGGYSPVQFGGFNQPQPRSPWGN